jgi:hypothetical protein
MQHRAIASVASATRARKGDHFIDEEMDPARAHGEDDDSPHTSRSAAIRLGVHSGGMDFEDDVGCAPGLARP